MSTFGFALSAHGTCFGLFQLAVSTFILFDGLATNDVMLLVFMFFGQEDSHCYEQDVALAKMQVVGKLHWSLVVG